jgi:hypothetical protein
VEIDLALGHATVDDGDDLDTLSGVDGCVVAQVVWGGEVEKGRGGRGRAGQVRHAIKGQPRSWMVLRRYSTQAR